MKIAIFTDTFHPQINGVVTSVLNISLGLAKKGHKVMIFTTVFPDKKFHKNIEVVAYWGIHFPSYKEYKLSIPTAIRPLMKLKKFNPDLIHVVTPFGIGAEGAVCAKILGIPVVGTHHTFYSECLKYIKLDTKITRNFTNGLTAYFFNKCDVVTAPSYSHAEFLAEYGVKKPIKVIPNSLENINLKTKNRAKLSKKYGLTGKTLVYMGRVSYEKSIDVLIKAVSLAVKKFPEIKLIVIGSGPNEKKLKSLVNDLYIRKNVIFTGPKKGQDLVDMTALGDVFITASKVENQPMSIIEAMALGMPLIGVRSKGVPELIKDNFNGLLANPDDIEGISACIIRLLNNNSLRKRFAKNSKRFSRQFSNSAVIKKWISLYRSLLK